MTQRSDARDRFVAWLTSLLERPRLPLWLAAASTLLLLPTLLLGFHLDDYVHRYLFSALPGAADLRRVYQSPFGIANGVVADNHFQVESGYAPWWIHPQLLISLLRPLSEFSHWLDAQLWPASSVLQHAHNLLWYAALVYAATLLYRAVLGNGLRAGLAALMYAFDQAHGFAVGWIANRNALISALFGVLALLAHHRARAEGRRIGAWLAPLWLAAALLSGEAAVAVLGYLFAHALWLESGKPVLRRVFGLWPYALVVIAWRAGYQALGRGAQFSGLYLDPPREPLQFAAAVVERAPLLLLGQIGLPPAEAALFLPAWATPIWLLAIAVALLLAYAVWPLLRADAHARFWTLGMLGALVLACTTHPNNRLLFFVGLGALPLLAQLWCGVVERAAWLRPGTAFEHIAGAFAMLAVGFHAFVSPLLLPLSALSIALTAPAEVAARSALAQAGGRDLVLVSSPDYFYAKLVPVLAALEHTPAPRRLRALSFGPVPLRIARPDARTLDVAFEGGLLRTPLLELYRARDAEMPVGTRVELEGMTIEVTALTPDRLVAAARFVFGDALDAAHSVFLVWDGDTYRPFALPAVGTSTHVAPAVLRLGH